MAVDHLENLRRAIEKRQAVFVVGAGVAVGATNRNPVASWIGLIEDGVARCEAVIPDLPKNWGDLRRQQIATGDTDELISAAEQIASRLGAPKNGPYPFWLAETVGRLHAEECSVLEALRDLDVLIATTNYDDLIEEVTGLEPVTWREGAKVERVLRGDNLGNDKRGVLHLHGHWKDPESVVFGIRSYQDVRTDPHAEAVLHALSLNSTLVFIGYGAGLADPNFSALLDWRRQVLARSSYSSYRLARSVECERLQALHIPAEHIVVLPYGDDHKELAPFLRRLRPSGSSASPPTVTSGTPSSPTSSDPSAPPSAPTALAPRPRCFGRETLVQQLADAMLALELHPVPVLGSPGIGKSTVALTALYEPRVVAHFGARRFFVPCDAARSAEAVQREVALAVALPLGPELGPRLCRWLAETPAALVLDNFETPWEADPTAAEDLLREFTAIAGLALVATLRGSQRPQRVTWAESAAIPPLDLPSARDLFLAVAGQNFREDPLLDDLLTALDGVPLAVELMAYLAEGEPNLSGLWHRWQAERTALLTRRGLAGRLESVEVSLELSIAGPRMTNEARRLLSVLANLPDGIAHCDIPEILAADAHPPRPGVLRSFFDRVARRTDPPEPLPPLTPAGSLAAATTLRQVGLAYDKQDRLLLLAPIREHVSLHHPAHASDLARAFEHYGRLAIDLGPRAGAEGGADAIARLAPELANLDAAILTGLAASRPERWLPPAICLTDFLRFSCLGSNALLLEAREVAHRRGVRELEASCLLNLGHLALDRSNPAEARARVEEALPLYRRVGDVLGQANCMGMLGRLALRSGDPVEAQARFEEALPLHRRVDHVLGEANTIANLGRLALWHSDLAAAEARFEEALPLYQRAGDVLGEANTIANLGRLALRRSDPAAARVRFEEALPFYRRVGDVLAEVQCILDLDRSLPISDVETATTLLRKAAETLEKAASRSQDAATWNLLGDIYSQQGRLPEAIRAYRKACEIAPDAATYWFDLGTAHVHHGSPQDAVDALAKTNELRPGDPATLNNLAGAFLDMGRLEEAADFYRQRLEVRPEDAINARVSLGVLAWHAGRRPEAEDHFRTVLESLGTAETGGVQSPAGLLENKALALLALGQQELALVTMKDALRQLRPSDHVELVRYDLLAAALDPPEGLAELRSLLQAAGYSDSR